jgi:hypothetical protein
MGDADQSWVKHRDAIMARISPGMSPGSTLAEIRAWTKFHGWNEKGQACIRAFFECIKDLGWAAKIMAAPGRLPPDVMNEIAGNLLRYEDLIEDSSYKPVTYFVPVEAWAPFAAIFLKVTCTTIAGQTFFCSIPRVMLRRYLQQCASAVPPIVPPLNFLLESLTFKSYTLNHQSLDPLMQPEGTSLHWGLAEFLEPLLKGTDTNSHGYLLDCLASITSPDAARALIQCMSVDNETSVGKLRPLLLPRTCPAILAEIAELDKTFAARDALMQERAAVWAALPATKKRIWFRKPVGILKFGPFVAWRWCEKQRERSVWGTDSTRVRDSLEKHWRRSATGRYLCTGEADDLSDRESKKRGCGRGRGRGRGRDGVGRNSMFWE